MRSNIEGESLTPEKPSPQPLSLCAGGLLALGCAVGFGPLDGE